MATLTVQVQGDEIHAEIAGGSFTMLTDTSAVIDVLTNSYSNLGVLGDYQLLVSNITGLTQIRVLENGKKSRFSAAGTGTCDLTLTVNDDQGNTDSDTITITVI